MNVPVAIQQALLADSGVAAMAGSRVYPFELPPDVDLLMPIRSIVITPHGGPASFKMLQLNDTRLVLDCYGDTPDLAHRVYLAAYMCLKNLVSYKSTGTYIHWVNSESADIPGRDPQLQWPRQTATFLARASDLTVT